MKIDFIVIHPTGEFALAAALLVALVAALATPRLSSRQLMLAWLTGVLVTAAVALWEVGGRVGDFAPLFSVTIGVGALALAGSLYAARGASKQALLRHALTRALVSVSVSLLVGACALWLINMAVGRAAAVVAAP